MFDSVVTRGNGLRMPFCDKALRDELGADFELSASCGAKAQHGCRGVNLYLCEHPTDSQYILSETWPVARGASYAFLEALRRGAACKKAKGLPYKVNAAGTDAYHLMWLQRLR